MYTLFSYLAVDFYFMNLIFINLQNISISRSLLFLFLLFFSFMPICFVFVFFYSSEYINLMCTLFSLPLHPSITSLPPSLFPIQDPFPSFLLRFISLLYFICPSVIPISFLFNTFHLLFNPISFVPPSLYLPCVLFFVLQFSLFLPIFPLFNFRSIFPSPYFSIYVAATIEEREG